MNKNNQKRKVLAEDVALARYSVISPLVCREMDPVEYTAELTRVQSAVHLFPDGPKRVSKRSISRWCNFYRKGRPPAVAPGFDALLPDVRSDLGVARSLDAEVVKRAIALREEAPSRKTGRLIDMIVSEARLANKKPPKICESTLNYHLRAHGATRKTAGPEQCSVLRQEEDQRQKQTGHVGDLAHKPRGIKQAEIVTGEQRRPDSSHPRIHQAGADPIDEIDAGV